MSVDGFNAATITILVAVAGSAIGVMTLVVTLFVQLRTDIRAVEGRLNDLAKETGGRFNDLDGDIKTLINDVGVSKGAVGVLTADRQPEPAESQ